MLIESTYVNSYLMAIVMLTLCVTVIETFAVEMCMALIATISLTVYEITTYELAMYLIRISNIENSSQAR